MNSSWTVSLSLVLAVLLGGCATRPVNPPIAQTDPGTGYRLETRQATSTNSKDNLVILAFSGGGTRAAAFSYGVLEFLRQTEVVGADGTRVRLLDSIDVITGVSGGSFTALAYGLYGEKLFDDYEQRFLKRNVQGELIARALSPRYWGDLSSEGWGRSELASQLYDEILFNGATFGDLDRGKGPFIVASATDISTGSRFAFQQGTFDVICSDLNAVRLSRAAAASSAVPVVLSPITIRNYGGTCNWTPPAWTKPFLDADNPPRPAARAIRSIRNVQAYGDGARRPYLHLVDGGVSDNVGMRGVLDALEVLQTLQEAGFTSSLDNAKRIIVFVVNSLSSPPTNWDQSYTPPGTADILLKSAGTPIDAFSYETIESLKDTAAHWATMRLIRNSAAFSANKDPAVAAALRVPSAEIYAIDVSFAALKDKSELEFLNRQPTAFVLEPEAVDRLRAAGGAIIRESPEFKRLLKDLGARIVDSPAAGPGWLPSSQANRLAEVTRGAMIRRTRSSREPGGRHAAFPNPSRRDAKTDFAPVDAGSILDKVASLPITTWRCRGGDVRHIGPMAEDFSAAFEVGYGPHTIANLDARGVALAAIQGLNAKLEAERAAKDAEIAALRADLTEIRLLLQVTSRRMAIAH